MATKASTTAKTRSKNGRGRSAAASNSYDRFKEHEGKRYTGMQVGRRHKWRYDQGEWSEKKVTPDKWEFSYAVTKRRAGRAPEGSGAPVGTAYRWYILAHQVVTKMDANSYTTEMVGLKYKLAHKRADKDTWSASERAQRKRLVQVLEELIAELQKEEQADGERAPAKSAKRKAATPISAARRKKATAAKSQKRLPKAA